MNPLDQLSDIRLPEDPSAWPPAIGYYIVCGLTVLIIVIVCVYIQKRRARLKIQKQSINTLRGINLRDRQALKQIHHVLKSATQSYLPEHDVLQMQGSHWGHLVRNLYRPNEQDGVCDTLIQLAHWQYDERCEIPSTDQVCAAAQRWIEKALPPNAKHYQAPSQTKNSVDTQGVANV